MNGLMVSYTPGGFAQSMGFHPPLLFSPANFNMSQVVKDFTDLLIKRGLISLEQLSEAEQIAKDTKAPIADVLVKLEYASPEDVAKAMANFHKIPFVDLRETRIPEDVIEL